MRLLVLASILFWTLDASGQSKLLSASSRDTIILARDTPLLRELQAVDLKKFAGKKVRRLFTDTTLNKYRFYFWSTEPPGHLSAWYLVYAEGSYPGVRVDNVKNQRSLSRTSDFDSNLLKKERAWLVESDAGEFIRDRKSKRIFTS